MSISDDQDNEYDSEDDEDYEMESEDEADSDDEPGQPSVIIEDITGNGLLEVRLACVRLLSSA